MSDFLRIKRLAKSFLPNLGKSRTQYYNFEDAKMMINDLALAIPADLLPKLLDSNTILDDFLTCIYQLEDAIGKKDVITEDMSINPVYKPKVYVDGEKIAFTATYGLLSKEEMVFAEYNFGDPYIKNVTIE
jgi:hypothetical protein